MRIVHATRVLNESLTMLKKATEPEICISRGEQAIRQLQELRPYYEKGLIQLKPSPSEWVARIYHAERRIIDQHIQHLLTAITSDTQRAITKESRIQQLDHVIGTVERYREQLGDAKATDWKKRIETYMGTILLKKAETDVELGRRERAIDQYLEALDILRAEDDEGNSNQKDRIEQIILRIKELGGTVPTRWDSTQEGDGMPTNGSVSPN